MFAYPPAVIDLHTQGLPLVLSSSSLASLASRQSSHSSVSSTSSSPQQRPTRSPGKQQKIETDVDLYQINKMERMLLQDEQTKQQQYVYIGDVTTHLRCVICTQPYVQPTMHSVCGQTMCHSCVEQWKANGNAEATSCPVCRGALNASTLIAAPRCIDAMLDELSVQCTQCKLTMQRGDFDAHRHTDCTHTNSIVNCSQGCGLQLPAHQLDIHTKIDCPNAYLTCPSASEDLDTPSPCTFKGTKRQLVKHTQRCQYVQTQLTEEVAEQESNLQAESLHKYRHLFSQANQYNLKLRAKLNSTMMDTLIERTVFSVYGSSKSGVATQEQADELVDCALTIVDLLGEFCNYVLDQPVHQMQSYAMKRYLQPAVRELNTNLQLLQQRYGTPRANRSRSTVSATTRSQRSASVSTPPPPRTHLTMSSNVQQPSYYPPGPFAVARSAPTMHTSASDNQLSTQDRSPRPRSRGMWKRIRRAMTVQKEQ